MAFVRLARLPGATGEQFAAVSRALGDTVSPERLLFAAGPVEDGWQVVQAWTDRRHLDEFNARHLHPVLRALGVDGFPAKPAVTDFVPEFFDTSMTGTAGLSLPKESAGAFVAGYLDRVVNQRDIGAVADLVADGYRGSGPGWPTTRQELEAFYLDQYRTRPEWHIDVDSTVELGDSVAVMATAHGRVLDGPEYGQRALQWLAHYRLAQNRIVEINVLQVAHLGATPGADAPCGR